MLKIVEANQHIKLITSNTPEGEAFLKRCEELLSKNGALDILKENPQSIVAGGAIAALYFTDVKLPINDIDLFYVDKNEKTSASDYQFFDTENPKAYEIKKVEEWGLLNLISCVSLGEDFQVSLISSFDFNYVQIGVFCINGQLVGIKTEVFERFEKNRVVEMLLFSKPLQNLIRYLKKKQEVDFKFCEIGLKKALILSQSDGQIPLKNYGYFNKYATPDLIGKFNFGLPRNENGLDLVPFNYGGEKDLNEVEQNLPINMKIKVADLIVCGSKKQKKNYELIRKYPHTLRAFCQMGRDSLNKDFSIKYLEEYEKILSLHNTIPKEKGFTQVVDLFSWLEEVRVIKNNSQIVQDNLGPFITFSIGKGEINKDAFIEFVNSADQKLCQPLDHGFSMEGVSFKELTTSTELKLEGESLSHCVWGYAYKVKNGHCRIFSLSDGENRSTLEYCHKSNKILQHRSKFNSNPSEVLQEAVLKFVKYIDGGKNEEKAAA